MSKLKASARAFSPISPLSKSIIPDVGYFNAIGNVINRSLTWRQFKQIPKGYGGRVGVLLYYNEDGVRHYILNISNRKLYSDFGGGVKAKSTPYEGLVSELVQEVPQWSDELLRKMGDMGDKENRMIIYNNENIETEEKGRKLRMETMIILPVDKSILSTFRETKEVKELVVMNEDEFYALLFNTVMVDDVYGDVVQHLNNGLVMIRNAIASGWVI
uniref:Uncharacterized protein n=1 Tax=viral metagenome TaxID=1070528 RepID=A0A6C0KE62_9ZZZZ